MEKKKYETIQTIGDIPTGFGRVSLNKKKEKICGDYYTVITDTDQTVLVLSDGLGSGVKANILATLTARMLSIMIARNMDIRTAVKLLQIRFNLQLIRNLAYATFTVLVSEGMESVFCSTIIRMLFCFVMEKVWIIIGIF